MKQLLGLVIHEDDVRRAVRHENGIGDILEDEYKKGAFTGQIHCFSSGPEIARGALALGMYISISGIVTFKAAEALRTTERCLRAGHWSYSESCELVP